MGAGDPPLGRGGGGGGGGECGGGGVGGEMTPDQSVELDMASEVGWLSQVKLQQQQQQQHGGFAQVTGRLVPMIALLQRGVLFLLPDERCCAVVVVVDVAVVLVGIAVAVVVVAVAVVVVVV